MTPSVHKLVPLEELQLDKHNPRINRYIANYAEVSQEAIHMALGAGGDTGQESGTTFASLRESIRTNGGIIHPIIVNKQSDGKLIVIEGNTRLAIYQSFRAENSPGEWSNIPCIVYDQLPQEAIDAIRLQAHLVGPRAWDPYSKARYLHYLRTFEQMDFGRLSDYCGGRKREVEKYISAYTDMETFYRPLVNETDFDPKKFSSFVEMQTPPTRKQALLKAGLSMVDFSQWVVDDLFDKQEDVRDLPRILAHPKAKAVFLKDGSRKAKLLLDAAAAGSDLSGLGLSEVCAAFIQKLQQIARKDLDDMRSDPDGDLPRLLKDAAEELKITLRYLEDDSE
jgi:hypothetical protein